MSRFVPRVQSLAAIALAWTVTQLGACATDAVAPASPPPFENGPVDAPSAGDPQPMRIGNQAKGVEEQPDYDAEAEQVREEVAADLPDPLPTAKVACFDMLKAVRDAYLKREGADAVSLRTLDATRSDDLRACESQTPPAAAACVTILARHEGGEFPQMLDQCTRAFR